jgi:hypothetical protein
MKADALPKYYGGLAPEERFRLILAASGRGDQAERDRLVRAGRRVTLALQDHAPYAQAFGELALLTFIELLDEAARFHAALDEVCAFDDTEEQVDRGGRRGDGAGGPPAAAVPKHAAGDPPGWERYLELAYAAGYVLRAKAGGWKLFCERLAVPPFLLWEVLPGLDRLRCALELAEEGAFSPDDFLRWLNGVRPAGAPELTAVPLSAERLAEQTQESFRTRAKWWGGSG